MKRQMTSGSRAASSLLGALLFVLFACTAAPAQSGTSTVRGTVADPQGQMVAGATVTLVNTETNQTRNQTTNDTGSFGFDLIQPGTYRLEAEAAGFKKQVLTDVNALVSKPTDVSVVLEVGAVTETVTVSAGSGDVLLNTQDATIGNNFVSQQITQLPLESRNVVQLLSLQPGVTREGYVAGSRSDQANVTLDGVDVNEQQTGLDPLTLEAFASVLRVTPDSIQEFRVTTINPNASQGRSAGAQVSLITKGGTNDFNGSLYWFHRNTITTANDFFNNRAGLPREKLLRNLFGGSIGGPVKRDRLFFFYAYEGRRDASEESVVRDVPLASLGRGEVRYRNAAGELVTLSPADINTLFPALGVNTAALAVLADAARRYPANDTNLGDGLNTGGFRFNASTPLKWNTHTARFDFNLSDRHQLFARGNYQHDLIGRVPQFPDTPAPNFWNHPSGFVIGHTWTASNTLVNDFRYGLTREAFTTGGDSGENRIAFRFVFEPFRFTRTTSRTTPVHNFTDDVSWTRGNHNIQFGGNVRLIKNNRTSFGSAFDTAVANPSYYEGAGGVLLEPLTGARAVSSAFEAPVQAALTSVFGAFSEYTANFTFGQDGELLPSGTPTTRTFATQQYDFYVQDSWKIRPNLTLNLGLRYGVGRPVYEVNGFQVKPTPSLGELFERRRQGAAEGRPVNDLVTFNLAGPANNGEHFYDTDWNNFQPRVSVAWSPEFTSGFLGKLFGSGGTSVIRGGFSITHDQIGQHLAVDFDTFNSLGFVFQQGVAAETYNVTDNPPPLFTGFGQAIRPLEGINVPSSLTFPIQFPADEDLRIESALDDTITTPVNYSWSFSFGRKLPAGLFIETSYLGRVARNLLATRDVMALNNLVDPASGMDWYTAGQMLDQLRLARVPITSVQPIPYFENLFPAFPFTTIGGVLLTPTQQAYRQIASTAVGGRNNDYTTLQLFLDDVSTLGPNVFYHPQYAALSAFSTVAESDYHAGTLTLRQRLGNDLSLDFNYTLSKSMDTASTLLSSTSFASILNPLRPEDNRSVSDFDVRHIVNFNSVWQLPLGRGKRFWGDLPGAADAVLGGWQLTSIFRWNSGLPVSAPFDANKWATNWNVQSNGVRIRPVETSPTRGGLTAPNLFSDPVAAYQSFRNAAPGETGDRNIMRRPGFVTLDIGLNKFFPMPWSEDQKLQLRWEVFNVTNTQRMGTLVGGRSGYGLQTDPQRGQPAPSFGNFSAIQGEPRVMQFGLRYTF